MRADLFGSTDTPGEQGAGRVADQVLDGGDTPGGGQRQRQQGQDLVDGGDRCGAGVAGLGDQGGQVEGDQVGDHEQQPGQAGCRRGRGTRRSR